LPYASSSPAPFLCSLTCSNRKSHSILNQPGSRGLRRSNHIQKIAGADVPDRVIAIRGIGEYPFLGGHTSGFAPSMHLFLPVLSRQSPLKILLIFQVPSGDFVIAHLWLRLEKLLVFWSISSPATVELLLRSICKSKAD
jgi:hypothetical protein